MQNLDYREKVTQCTRCGKEFTDLKIEIGLAMDVWRLKETGVWEGIANLDQRSTELLCPDCFNILADVLAQMNIPYNKESPRPKKTAVEESSSCKESCEECLGETIRVDPDVVYKETTN